MGLGEGALALQARRDGRFEEFSQVAKVRPRAGVVHALPGIDNWALRTDEQMRHRGNAVLAAPCRVARQGSRGARPTTNTAYHHVCTAGVPATRVIGMDCARCPGSSVPPPCAAPPPPVRRATS